MAFEWLVRLQDAVSDPASRVERSLKRVTSSLRELQAQQKSYASNAYRGLGYTWKADTLAAQSLILRLRNQRDEIKNTTSVTKVLGGAMKDARQWTRDWVQILAPLTSALSFVADRASDVGKSIASAIGTRQEASIGFKTAFGSHGGAMLDMVQDVATRTGRPFKSLEEDARMFGNLGAPEKMIKPMLFSISDADAMGVSAEKVRYAFEQMLSKPTLDLKEMQGALTGVTSETLVWAQAAKDVGTILGRTVSVGEFEGMTKHHMIGGSIGAQALQEVLQARQGGALGKTTFERADNTLPGILDTFAQKMEKKFADLGKTNGFNTFQDVLKNLLSVLSDDKAGKYLTNLANSLGKVLEPLSGPEGKKKMEDFFTSMQTKIEGILLGLQTFAGLFEKLGQLGLWSVEKVGQLNDLGGVTFGKDGVDLDYGGKNKSPWHLLSSDAMNINSLTPVAQARMRAAQSGAFDDHLDRELTWTPKNQITLTVHVDARGATADDATAIGQKTGDVATENLADLLDKLNKEDGN